MHDHNGVSVEAVWPCFLAVFPKLIDAVGCTRTLRGRLSKRIRAGVNLGEFQLAPDGAPGPDSTYAKWLMEQSKPGGACISGVAGDRITSRVGADEEGERNKGTWPPILFATLQWTGLLGYF